MRGEHAHPPYPGKCANSAAMRANTRCWPINSSVASIDGVCVAPVTMTRSGIATLGIVLGAVYMLSMVRRVFFGEITKPENLRLHDLTLRERLIVGILCVFMVWIGVKPAGWLKLSETTVHAMVAPIRPQILQVRAPADYDREMKAALRAAHPMAAVTP